MKSAVRYITLASVGAMMLTFSLCGCNNGTQSNSSSQAGVGDTSGGVSEEAETSADETEAPTADETEAPAEGDPSDVPDGDVSAAQIDGGRFSLNDGEFSFELSDGWNFEDTGIAYQFENEDYAGCSFNLVLSDVTIPAEDLTADNMSGSYPTLMSDYELVDFKTMQIDQKPAAYICMSGTYSMMTVRTTISQYIVQSGDKQYTLSFSQTGENEEFSQMIASLADSIEVK